MHNFNNKSLNNTVHNLGATKTPDLRRAIIIACIISLLLHGFVLLFFFKLYSTLESILSYQSPKSLPIMRVSIVKAPEINKSSKKEQINTKKNILLDKNGKIQKENANFKKIEEKISTKLINEKDVDENVFGSNSQEYASNTPYEYAVNSPPVYPELAREKGYEGLVLLEVLVSSQGKSINVRVIKTSGFDILDLAAMDAVKEWKFIPASREGVPTKGKVRIPISFELSD